MTLSTKTLDIANDLISFLNAGPSPFHCVEETKKRLLETGFSEVSEAQSWEGEPGKGFFTKRSGSLIAWRMGNKPPLETGFRIVGAHTDSPNLRLKPRPAKTKQGYLQFDVDVYGGVLLATWGDRDLGLAGRIFYQQNDVLEETLINIDRPLCRIPNLAIHLNREVNKKGLVFNKNTHLGPILSLWSKKEEDPVQAVYQFLGETLQINKEDILGHELCLYDIQPGAFSGLQSEFIHSARLDNQAMCHAALCALIDTPSTVDVTGVIALFDHEEVGSTSERGAGGPFLEDILDRLSGKDSEAKYRALAKSFLVSADMAHAVHPNYSDMHDEKHMPRINEGPVIKTNYNQRYATDAESGALFRSLCQKSDVPFQEFVNRPDLACGSTIGPISAARLGVRTVDVGNPMLSMHSIREMSGSQDPELMIRVMQAFLSGEK